MQLSRKVGHARMVYILVPFWGRKNGFAAGFEPALPTYTMLAKLECNGMHRHLMTPDGSFITRFKVAQFTFIRI